MVRSNVALVILAAVFWGGCSSPMTLVAPDPPADYVTLGPAEGKAFGSLLIGQPLYNFIPLALNSRVERAYQRAVDSVSGATGLINVTLQESWWWWVIGTTRTVTIRGEAIQ